MDKIQFTKTSDAYLIPFLLHNANKKNPFILVVPGGGYNHYGKKNRKQLHSFLIQKVILLQFFITRFRLLSFRMLFLI